MNVLHSATQATTPRHFWLHAVSVALAAKGVDMEWLRESAQHERLVRYYNAGEAAWMAIDTMAQFWAGKQRADREDADGFAHIMRAARAAR